MHKKIIYRFLILIVSCSSSSESISIDDFELGNFDKWTISGNAFSQKPAKSTDLSPNIQGFEGNYLVSSYQNQDLQGMLYSKEFVLKRDYLNFLIGGGVSKEMYIELIINGKTIYKSSPTINSETLQWHTWNIKPYRNQTASLRIVDNQKGEWGYLLIDQIEQNNLPKNVEMTNYFMYFDISKKYLLLPIEEEAPEILIQLMTNQQNKEEPIHIRLAKTKIDYWVPLSVEKFENQTIAIAFSYIEKSDIGFSQIQQADTFDFNYYEKYRPLFHFSPYYGYMNKPIGIFYKENYHLFFQYNPYASVLGNGHLGHAISSDFINWKYMPIAMSPDKLGAITSASIVSDKNNTAGFGKEALIAIYTAGEEPQTLSIAYSLDGCTFAKYTKNPILIDKNTASFDGLKIFWYEPTKQWIMVAASLQNIDFYGSKNLKKWNKLGEFKQNTTHHWQYPDLFPLPYKGKNKWVLLVGEKEKNSTLYFIGNFDGKTFTPDGPFYPQILDYGKDNYAATTWNIPSRNGEKLLTGWLSNEQYEYFIPTKHFRGVMTLPRNLSLASVGEQLFLQNGPTQEVTLFRQKVSPLQDMEINNIQQTIIILHENSQAASYEIEFSITPTEQARIFGFVLANKHSEQISVQFNLDTQKLLIDRSQSGSNLKDSFTEPIEAPIKQKTTYKIRLFVDVASTELFINDGEISLTNLVFPTEPYNLLSFETNEGQIQISKGFIYKLSR